jgi:DNA-binding transcriptional MerR regulator
MSADLNWTEGVVVSNAVNGKTPIGRMGMGGVAVSHKVPGELLDGKLKATRGAGSVGISASAGRASDGDGSKLSGESVNAEVVGDVTLDGFRGPQVCRLVGISYRQLDYWARTGLLTPSVASARGSGTQRLYSYKDVLEIKVIKRLLDAGVSLKIARKAVECLRDAIGGDLASSTLVMAGDRSILVHSSDEVVDLLRGGQGVFSMIPLEGVVNELETGISTLPVNVNVSATHGSSPGAGSADSKPDADQGRAHGDGNDEYGSTATRMHGGRDSGSIARQNNAAYRRSRGA